jgi:hypothetical protein
LLFCCGFFPTITVVIRVRVVRDVVVKEVDLGKLYSWLCPVFRIVSLNPVPAVVDKLAEKSGSFSGGVSFLS